MNLAPLFSLTDWVVRVMDALGPWGAGLLVLIENVFPPIPSELVLPLAGFTAQQGRFSVTWAIIACTVGSVVGAWVLYWLGHRLGRERTRAALRRLPLFEMRDFDRADGWFTRHGRTSVLLGRMIPGVRSFISIPAGLAGMPAWQFTAYTTLGSLAWNSLLIGAGYLLGAQWHRVGGYVDRASTFVTIAIVALLAWFIVHRARKHRRDPEAARR